AKLVAHLGRVAGDVDVEVGELGGLAGESLQRAVVTLDERGGFHRNQVAEHQALFDEAFHSAVPPTVVKSAKGSARPAGWARSARPGGAGRALPVAGHEQILDLFARHQDLSPLSKIVFM